MAVHLIKLCVGADSIAELEQWQKARLKEKTRSGATPELIHVTRNMPKRAEELLEAGSLYWVIKGWVCARQRITELRPLTKDGIAYCGIVLDKKVVHVQLQPRRPFQGWRYLEAREAPRDIAKGTGGDELPEAMRRELAELGLL